MLSRLISLLRRIPAVEWAITRLRPSPHGDVAPVAASNASAIIADIAKSAPAINTAPVRDDADTAVTAPVAEHDTAVSVLAESPSAAPSDISISDDSSRAALSEVGVVAIEEASVASVDVESDPVEVSNLVVDASLGVPVEVEPVVADEAPVFLVDAEVSTADVPEAGTDSDPSPSAAIEIEPVAANDPPVVAAAPVSTEPSPALAPPSPEIRSAPKAPARVAEPIDRASLIRRRWAETGIRMWNPRLHGTGDATLNIQGRVELLPPAPGETMPQYDKLEFKMLGGQIVCEGVIVEAPAHAGQRSFTRLAEPGKSDRVREPVRERQAVLA